MSYTVSKKDKAGFQNQTCSLMVLLFGAPGLNWIICCGIVILALAFPNTSYSAGDKDKTVIPPGAIYQYYDDKGNRHIGQGVPPEYIKNGYVVKDSFGQVVIKVDKAYSEEELAKMDAAEAKNRLFEKQKQEQAERDKILLRNFSSPADAQRALNRKLAALDVIIDITKGNVIQLESDYEEQQRTAADFERSGKKVPDYIYERLDSLKEQIDDAFRFIKVKQDEKKLVTADYNVDIERLKVLQKEQNKQKVSEYH